jgi:hypothetical protein
MDGTSVDGDAPKRRSQREIKRPKFHDDDTTEGGAYTKNMTVNVTQMPTGNASIVKASPRKFGKDEYDTFPVVTGLSI